MTKQDKIQFLKNLKAGKTTIEQLTIRAQVTEFWDHENGFYTDTSTGGRYSDSAFEARPKPQAKELTTVIFEDYS